MFQKRGCCLAAAIQIVRQRVSGLTFGITLRISFVVIRTFFLRALLRLLPLTLLALIIFTVIGSHYSLLLLVERLTNLAEPLRVPPLDQFNKATHPAFDIPSAESPIYVAELGTVKPYVKIWAVGSTAPPF